MPSINLAPGTQYIITARKRRMRLYGISVAIAVLFFVGWLGLFFYLRILSNSSEGVKMQIDAVNQKIQSLRDDATRVSLFERRLVDVSQLLDKHIGWDKVFTDLERLLPGDTVLTSFDATDGNSSITVQGTTSNVDQIALALASLTQGPTHPSVFSKGTITSIQRQELKNGDAPVVVLYAFTMTLDFDSTVLRKATTL